MATAIATKAPSRRTKVAKAVDGVVNHADGTTRSPARMTDEDKHRLLKSWFELEMRRQEISRYQRALDCDYYDGYQWTNDEARAIRARGQNPIVFNEIMPTIDWLKGTQRRMRRDFKVLARFNQAKEAGDDADLKTQLLKYIDDANRGPFARSRAADDQMISGLGYLYVGIGLDPEAEQIEVRHSSWRYHLHDSFAEANDGTDDRYHFVFKEIDLDIAKAYFPKKETQLERAANFGSLQDVDGQDWAGAWPTDGILGDGMLAARWLTYSGEADLMNCRRRVALVECWYREPVTDQHGRVVMRMRVAIFTKHDLLLDIDSPYRHNRCPYIPMWCYRTHRDGMPYGKVRNIRGPQDDLNKRFSKSQFLLGVNQVRAEKGAIDTTDGGMDEDELRDELDAPDGFSIWADGALSGGKVQVREGSDVLPGHMALLDRNMFAIRSTSGVSMESRAQDTSAPSGKARAIKAEQQSVSTAEVFDNQLLTHQLEGEITLALIEQFYTDEKTFSVTGSRYKLDYYTINKVDPATGQRINDVTAFKAQFVIGEQPWRQALAEAAFESVMEMLGQVGPVAPQVVTAIIDLVFEWSDLPNKSEILQRIRSVTGMPDPEGKEDPKQAAEQRQKAEIAKLEFELNMAKMRADIREAEAKGLKLETESMAKKMEALYMSAQAAQVLVMAPSATPVADELLKSAGFQDSAAPAQGVIDTAAMPVQPAAPVAAQPMPGPAADPLQADGAMQGIETPAADGVQPQPPQGAIP